MRKFIGSQIMAVTAMRLERHSLLEVMNWSGGRCNGQPDGSLSVFIQRWPDTDGPWSEVLFGEWVLKFPDGHLEIWGDIAFRGAFEEVQG